jgi:glyoxylase-like metal-dependent hydrolase (beta-lactamase superfamily II)
VILNTHCHFDHIGGNYDLKEKYGCRIISHKKDREAIESLNHLSLYSMALERGLKFKPTKVDQTVDDKDIIKIGSIDLKVVSNPGHTPGCISLLLTENRKKSLLCGDIAGPQGRLGYINGPGFNLKEWKNSIKKLVDLEPERLFPGHNTFLMGDATMHLKLYDQKMNAAWTTIITSIG